MTQLQDALKFFRENPDKSMKMDGGGRHVEVHQQLRYAIENDMIQSIDTELFDSDTHLRFKATVTLILGDRTVTATGWSEVPKGGADTIKGTFPLESAETRAVGRAFAKLGFMAEDSMVTADEMVYSSVKGDSGYGKVDFSKMSAPKTGRASTSTPNQSQRPRQMRDPDGKPTEAQLNWASSIMQAMGDDAEGLLSEIGIDNVSNPDDLTKQQASSVIDHYKDKFRTQRRGGGGQRRQSNPTSKDLEDVPF